MLSNHLILYHPLLLPLIFPSISVFSNESALHIRWPKYWSFSFGISSSSEPPPLPPKCLNLLLRLWEKRAPGGNWIFQLPRRLFLPVPTPVDKMRWYTGNIQSFESPRHGNEVSDLLFNLHFYKCIQAVGHWIIQALCEQCPQWNGCFGAVFSGVTSFGKLSTTRPQRYQASLHCWDKC